MSFFQHSCWPLALRQYTVQRNHAFFPLKLLVLLSELETERQYAGYSTSLHKALARAPQTTHTSETVTAPITRSTEMNIEPGVQRSGIGETPWACLSPLPVFLISGPSAHLGNDVKLGPWAQEALSARWQGLVISKSEGLEPGMSPVPSPTIAGAGIHSLTRMNACTPCS